MVERQEAACAGNSTKITDRQRLLASIRGEPTDRIPFVPRLEFWHRGCSVTGTLPPELHGLSLRDIADRLGVGWYATVPDFTDVQETEFPDYSLGILHLPVLPFAVSLEGVERHITKAGRKTVVEYRTPVGAVSATLLFTQEMLTAGVSMPCTVEYPVKTVDDLEPVGYIFSHLKVEPRMTGYHAACRHTGERGVVVGYASMRACPMHHIMGTLMAPENFVYAYQDAPALIERLAQQMEPYYHVLKRVAAASPAEIISLGGNYDDSLTSPPFFRKYILPSLRQYSDLLHETDKFLMTHTDGENRRLLPLYVEAGFDIADSVCPSPMTRCDLDEIREKMGDRITIWGGIPSVLLCAGSATWDEFRGFVDRVIRRYGHESHFVLGVSDMVTADADWGRLQYIAEQVTRLS